MVSDLIWLHRNLYVAKECAEIRWALPKGEASFYDTSDNPWLSVLYWAYVFNGDDVSPNGEQFCLHIIAFLSKNSDRVPTSNIDTADQLRRCSCDKHYS